MCTFQKLFQVYFIYITFNINTESSVYTTWPHHRLSLVCCKVLFLLQQSETEEPETVEERDMEVIDSSQFRPDPLQYELYAVIGKYFIS